GQSLAGLLDMWIQRVQCLHQLQVLFEIAQKKGFHRRQWWCAAPGAIIGTVRSDGLNRAGRGTRASGSGNRPDKGGCEAWPSRWRMR
ncbi:hypothetical protein ACSTIO_23395, partial [Vibrio parahaemolyticus]